MAIVNATSNVLFLPYMAAFHPPYLTAYFVGMSFSSLIPSGVKLIQGVSRDVGCRSEANLSSITTIPSDPLFNVREYNLIMFGWLCLTTASFIILHWFSADGLLQKRHHKNDKNSDDMLDTPNSVRRVDAVTNSEQGENRPLRQRVSSDRRKDCEKSKHREGCLTLNDNTVVNQARLWTQITCLALICAEMNTIVPSVQSYAALPYSLLTYHLALTLNSLSHPLANFLPLWIKPKNLSFVVFLTLFCTLLTTVIFILALQSPQPVLYDTIYGGSIPVLSSVLFGFTASYLRTHITGLVRSEHHDDESRLFWCGLFMQIGSFVGAFVMFPLVNVWKIFQRAPPPLCGAGN